MPNECNRTGSLGEACFIAEATRHGLAVAKPMSTQRYDFLVDNGRRAYRVQVKSVARLQRANRCFHIACQRGRRPVGYTKRDADFIAAYIVPRDLWYIIPVSAVHPRKVLGLFPDVAHSRSRWERYRNAWNLLAR